VDCALGCASSTKACADKIINQIVAPLDFLVTMASMVLTGGASTAAKQVVKVALQNVKTAATAAAKSAAKAIATKSIRTFTKQAVKDVAAKLTQKAFVKGRAFSQLVRKYGKDQAQEYISGAQESLAQMMVGFQVAGESPEGAELVKELALALDPTGIGSIIDAYSGKSCQFNNAAPDLGDDIFLVPVPGALECASAAECADFLQPSERWDFGGSIGSDWKLVRRAAPAQGVWHQATDQLVGIDEYGVYDNNITSDNSFSINFEQAVPDFDEFLFMTGDSTMWLVASRWSITGEFYTNQNRPILASSLNSSPHQALWYRRYGSPEDPWVSLRDHSVSIGNGQILYGEASHSSYFQSMSARGGANVFIRERKWNFDGGVGSGWKLVRRVSPGPSWHPAQDFLRGTAQYGSAHSADESSLVARSTFSVVFDNLDFDEFLFATGDMSKWLIASKASVIDGSYVNEPRPVVASSISASPYQAKWFRRTDPPILNDPWISLRDHFISTAADEVVYGGGSHTFYTSSLQSKGGMNVFVRQKLYDFGTQIGSGWRLVRHVAPGSTWHAATDQLRGTAVYGIPGGPTSAQSFSINFANQDFDQFLFATGDLSLWLIAPSVAVLGVSSTDKYYTNGLRDIVTSSWNLSPYQARWYRREGALEDPWISVRDHAVSTTANEILYGENNINLFTASMSNRGGANVFIRVAP